MTKAARCSSRSVGEGISAILSASDRSRSASGEGDLPSDFRTNDALLVRFRKALAIELRAF
jgi:hypothetical protein